MLLTHSLIRRLETTNAEQIQHIELLVQQVTELKERNGHLVGALPYCITLVHYPCALPLYITLVHYPCALPLYIYPCTLPLCITLVYSPTFPLRQSLILSYALHNTL